MNRMNLMIAHSPSSTAPGQRGSALMIALVFLLLMTLIGITAMQSSTLQERMAGNTRDYETAFAASEGALRAAEEWMDDNASPALYLVGPLPNPGLWDGAGFTGSQTVDAALASQPVYHISRPQTTPPPGRAGIGRGGRDANLLCYFPVTSRGEGRSADTVVILRSRFMAYPCP